MNNKGFTLIELILVIAIIALLALVFTPNVLGLISKNNTDAYNKTLDTVKTAAKNYMSNHRYDDSITSQIDCRNNLVNTIYVSLSDLVASGDLSVIPSNPCKDSSILNFNDTDNVEVKFNCNSKEFSYFYKTDKELEISNCKNGNLPS